MSFNTTTELYEPDLNTPDMGKALPKETPLREEANTHPTCPYNPIQLTQTPLQGSHKKGLAFTTKTDELIFNRLAARAEIGYKSRGNLCQQNPLQRLNKELTKNPKLKNDFLPLSYIEIATSTEVGKPGVKTTPS